MKMPTEAEPVTIVEGDCLDVMARLPAGSVAAVVTDPPYGLEFMGKEWDSFKTSGSSRLLHIPKDEGREFSNASGHMWDNAKALPRFPRAGKKFQDWCHSWASAALRVLKPGGYMLAMGGTRTYHRLACAVEDAGFEIRDSILFIRSKPFDLLCNCTTDGDGSTLPYSHEKRSKVVVDCDVPSVREAVPQKDVLAQEDQGPNMLPPVQRKAARRGVGKARKQRAGGVDGGKQRVMPSQDDGTEQPGMEGRGDVSTAEGELCPSEVHQVPVGPVADGSSGRLCDGASVIDGSNGQAVPHPNGDGSPHRPQPAEQRDDEPRTVAGQRHAQTRRVGRICDRCGKPTVMPPGWADIFPPYLYWQYGSGFPKGKGCLKPAYEPILLARKPGKKVLELGIDECRVATNESTRRVGYAEMGYHGRNSADVYKTGSDSGRWPANVLHDGSEEVLEAFAEFGERRSAGDYPSAGVGTGNGATYLPTKPQGTLYGDSGTAARFFYTAKASRAERGEGNNHPTVKPLALMRWLARLVAGPGALVLDPFGGSGTTGLACLAENRRCILIEKEPAYCEIARRRVAEAMGTGLLAGVG